MELPLLASRARARLCSALLASGLLGLALACGGDDLAPGSIEGPARSRAALATDAAAQASARRALAPEVPTATPAKRILFGDLHVHTSYSIDAFVFALPLFGGEGTHPPADACDFARHCAALDFFSINDHAEGLTPERWRATRESIQQCNARAGDPEDPDLVAFLGWEWTQAGPTPETHYGHRNVIFPGLDEDQVPARPITSLPDGVTARARGMGIVKVLSALPGAGLRPYADFLWWMGRLADTPDCERGVDTRALPADCRENAATPAELFEKLDQWGLPFLVIPHGLAWGIHAPPGSTMRNQLAGPQHDPERQRLLEVFSGHGNSEELRPFPDLAGPPDRCPEPTPDFLPCCWRAGELMRERCGALPEAECEARVVEARKLALDAGVDPQLVFPDSRDEDWLDCDQCRDCFKPALSLRAGETAQYGLALSDFETPEPDGRPRRFRYGFIASSDNHAGRAGTGYKQLERLAMTDARGASSRWNEAILRRITRDAPDDAQRAQPVTRNSRSLQGLLDVERGASFLYPGGLVAVHAAGRDRASVWQALLAREVYGTSGPRILLWFDLLNGPAGRTPMGASVQLGAAPRFEVRAVGARVQQPGCPEESLAALSAERLERLCRSECHHPGDARHAIVAVEVVRVRPQVAPDEPVAPLVEDPWLRIPCEPDRAGCVVRFEDPDYVAAGRDAVYYVRALQAPTPAVNAANLRTEFDAEGRPLRVRPCHAGWRTGAGDDCLAPAQERAWSSPIYLDQPHPGAGP